MKRLSQPDQYLVSRLLKQVGFEQRLIGCRMRQRAGMIPASLYSFEEVVRFLDDRFPCLDLKNLEQWIRVVVADAELSAAVQQAIKHHTNYRDRLMCIKTLMKQRLCQCKKTADRRHQNKSKVT